MLKYTGRHYKIHLPKISIGMQRKLNNAAAISVEHPVPLRPIRFQSIKRTHIKFAGISTAAAMNVLM